jgi:hypothetical protein
MASLKPPIKSLLPSFFSPSDGLCQISQLIFDGQIHTGEEINEECQREEAEGPNEKSPVMAKGQNRWQMIPNNTVCIVIASSSNSFHI